MATLMEKLVKFFKDEEGAVATEYVLLIIFVALIILVGAKFFASSVSNKYNDIGTAIQGANVSPLN